MPELTPRLGIKKPLGNENVTRQSFNENWDIIDAKVETTDGAQAKVDTHAVVSATTSQVGHVKLSSATDSTSTTEAATPSAVKSAYDLARSVDTNAVKSTTSRNITTSPNEPVSADGIDGDIWITYKL